MCLLEVPLGYRINWSRLVQATGWPCWPVDSGLSSEPADGFTAYVIYWGPSRVQVHFIGPVGVQPSWLLCEGSPEVSCSFD